MLPSGMKCYHVGWNVIIWDEMLSSGANVIIWCYHVMLSSGMITQPFFIFPENFTHSTPIDNFRWKQKNQILSHLPRYDRIGKNHHTLLSLQISCMKKFQKKETDISVLLEFLISFGEKLCPIIGQGELSTARLRQRYRYYKHFFSLGFPVIL